MNRYESYKDSGVQWIGEIPEHWETRKIKFLFQERSEKGYPDEPVLCATQKYGVIPQSMYENRVVVANKGLDGLKLVKKGDFVISLRSFQGGIEYAHHQGIISAAYTVLIPSKHIDSHYVKYLFKSHPFIGLLQTCVTGIREGQNINYDMLRKKCITLPLPSEQQAIVDYLKDKTLKIDQCLIPEHWEVKRLGASFTENRLANSNLESTDAFQFNYGTLVRKKREYKAEEDAEVYAKYTLLKPNDIVVNGLNLNYDFVSQRVAIAKEEGIITSAYLTLRPRPKVNAEYFCFLLKTMDAHKLFHGMGTGIRLTLSFSEVKKQNIPVPPLSEQQAIVDYIDDKLKKIDQCLADLQSEIDYLKEFKQRLISDAVTGQIKVTN